MSHLIPIPVWLYKQRNSKANHLHKELLHSIIQLHTQIHIDRPLFPPADAHGPFYASIVRSIMYSSGVFYDHHVRRLTDKEAAAGSPGYCFVPTEHHVRRLADMEYSTIIT
jgi:hypothetical protein